MAGAHPPPFVLPGAHFAAALLSLALGAAGLVVVAPLLARGDILAPRVIAVTHLFTLGGVVTTFFGALYQFFPVALGVTLRNARVGLAGFWVLAAGVAGIVAGFWTWTAWLQESGWLLLFGAVGVLSWNLLPQRRRATDRRELGRYVSAGHTAFGVAMFLGLARIGETAGWWTFDRLGTIAAHFHLAAFGFAGLTAVGIGSRMIPMFLAADGAPTWPLRWIGPLAGAGLALYTVGAPLHLAPLRLAGAVLLAAGGVVYLRQVAGFFRARAVRRLDHALTHVAAAFAGLTVTLLTGLALAAGIVRGPRWWTAYVLVTLLGWLVPFILGVLYRVLPFLSWLHLFGPRAAAAAPQVQTLSRPAWARASLALLVAGLAVLAGGIVTGRAPVATAGAATYAAGVLLCLAHWGRVAVLYLRLAPAASSSTSAS